METRKLGQDLSVSALGYGCMGLSHAYGEALDEKEAVRVLREAFEAGYTFFDTAEVYGTEDDPHLNERLIGEALKEVRDKVQIATKFGIRFDLASSKRPYPLIPDSRPETIRRSVEGSLKRLRTDHIDLYFQHRIDPQVEPEIVAGVMADLIKEGKILHWGISEANKNYLRRALFALLDDLAARKNATPAQISLAWMLCKKPWIVPIPGSRHPERLRENAGAADVMLSHEEVMAIDEALDGVEMSQVFGGTEIKQTSVERMK